ncbi:ABC transporter ATP-binding protein [Thermophilibacter immobilis]|jgi:ABC-2 type transport system ATP-binding protein|uniref:ABC transporter ATP-binding protein n=1 Tax=Thermophilibacter immobilis TaxID=2779519 RepID=A0A7S7RV97_9ACTN|nr:ABC transporter ATP-binding protein [Thermophilibacter immobilis]QOY61440.1 ABC transporter ATP-binding protein [Thermophilibacter immobilis]
MAETSPEYAIEVNDVSMIFNIASEQLNNLKEYFIKLMRHELFFKEFRALDHVDFKVSPGEVVGLVGTNGSGKSTMLKCIAGVLEPSEGSVRVRGSIAPLIELGAGFDVDLTALENIYLNGALLGYSKGFIDAHLQDIIDFAELQDFMDMPLKNYSSGMVARIAFSIATVTEPDVLIVDETLSVGDVFFQEKCERRIREFIESGKVTVLFVSHSLEQVERICQRAIWIEKGVQRMDGPVVEVCQAYRAQFG